MKSAYGTNILEPAFVRSRKPHLPSFGGWVGLLGLLFVFCLPGSAAGQGYSKASPRNVEAAFLRNFARYVRWPPQVFDQDNSPWRICILGEDPFGEVLEKTFGGRTEQGRSFVIFRAENLATLPTCQIVFVAYQDAVRRRAALAELKKLPVLTVGDAPEFLHEGGIIRFQVSDYVEMGVNLDQARSVSLLIQAKVLEVSSEVVEDGSVRRRR